VLGRFFIKVTLQDLKIQRKWDLVFVYGASEEEDKEMFLSELAAVCSNRKKSYVDWGDFNILRFSFEKNKWMRRNKWSSLFNAIINSHDLREIDMSGGQYTWSNNQINPTLEKLDRFLMSSDWEDLFLLTTVHKVARDVSNHNPIILDTMESRDVKKRHSDLKRAG
jgi:chemotaxis regulatin CheY-phosphate phosphatase CheZ